MEYDKLLLYLIQCRADDFEIEFTKALSDGLKYDSLIDYYPLFAYAASIKELLSEEYSSDIFNYARKGNNAIWDILLKHNFIPSNYQQYLINYAKEYEMYDESDSYEDILDMSLSELESQGARKIDCDLYISAIIFDFERTKLLLDKGANPDAKLSIEYIKSGDEGDSFEDYYNIMSHCADYWYDVFEPCEYIMDTWKRGMDKEDEVIHHSMCSQLMISAAHKMMYDLLSPYSHESNS